MKEHDDVPQPIEHGFVCPHCGEPITMLLDQGSGVQEYIEDCEVCCNPIQLRVSVADHAVLAFQAQPLEQ